MSTLAIRLQKAFFKIPYSRSRRTKSASEALLEARIWMKSTSPDTPVEHCSYAVYLPGDVYSWVEFEFFFDFSSEEAANGLTEAGFKDRLRKVLVKSLAKQMPALEEPVVAVWFR